MRKVLSIIVFFSIILAIVINQSSAQKYFQGYWDQTSITKSSMSMPGSPKNKVDTQRIYYKPNKMKMVNEQKGEIVIFRLDKDVMWTIDKNNRTYTEMILSEMQAEMQNAQQAFSKSMQNLNPEQKKMMQKMMGGKAGSMFGSGQMPEISFKKTNESKTVNGYKCKKVLFLADNDPMMEIWMTDKYKLGGEFVKTYEKMGFFKGDVSKAANQIDGFPVQTKVTINTGFGTVETISNVKNVVKKSMQDSEFNLPKGLKKKNIQLYPK